MKKLFVISISAYLLFTVSSPTTVLAQGADDDASIEAEVNAVQGKPEPKVIIERESLPRQRSSPSVDEELALQERILREKNADATEVSSDRNVNRFPKQVPIFEKPPGPKQGGKLRVQHPRAAEGLIRINRDGSYQYRTPIKEKSKSSSVKFGSMTPPTITTDSIVTYKSMYGENQLFALNFDYVWQPFRSFGALGVRAGLGFATASAKGTFKTARPAPLGSPPGTVGETQAEESYNLFVVPASAFLEYRFEFARKQWAVPYLTGGGTYYGMGEVRNDGRSPNFAGAGAVGGGGGLLISISRWDEATAFTMAQEYDIADMWLVVEALAMQGLSDETDFTNQSVSAGIAIDF